MILKSSPILSPVPTAPDHSHQFAVIPWKIPTRQSIALISVHGDPAAAVGQEGAGGQNIYVRKMGEALAGLGWQVDMFTRKSNPNDPDIVEHSPHCRTIRLQAGPERYIPRNQLLEYLPAFIKSLKSYFKEGNYPLIHTNYWLSGWVGLQLKQELNLQWVHTYHSLGVVKYQTQAELPAIAQARLEIETKILETADRIIATSPQEAEDLQNLVSELGRVEILPCGIDRQIFQPQNPTQSRQILGLNPEDQVVLYVGRFDPRKGIGTLIPAVAHYLQQHPNPHLKLLLVGGSDPNQADGAERQRIGDLVNTLGLSEQVQFVGRVDHEALPTYYSAADVCVVPSYYEPFGLVAIEAMACGTPVIASDVGGLRFTVLPQETGLLVPARDELALSQALQRLLSNPSWAKALGQKGQAWVHTTFDWQQSARPLGECYRSLLAAALMGENAPRSINALGHVTPLEPRRASTSALAS